MLSCIECSSDFCSCEGKLVCKQGHEFPIKNNVPEILPNNYISDLKKTASIYGKLWRKDVENLNYESSLDWHLKEVQKVLPFQIVKGKVGLEIGCGYGLDSITMAQDNPNTHIFSVDLSEGVFLAEKLKHNLKNISFIRASATKLPFRDNTFDFVYSYGVLHHVPNSLEGFCEMVRVLKPRARFFLYLYEDHRDHFIKYYPLKLISFLRRLSTQLKPKNLELLSIIMSPFIVLFFSWPSRILSKLPFTQDLAKKIPFNFGKGLFSLRGDLYDRFAAPYEHRFHKQQLIDIFTKLHCEDLFFTKLEKSAGWVVSGGKEIWGRHDKI